MKYAIKYYYTPDEIADEVKRICSDIHPCKGYTMSEYDGPRRIENISRMVCALHENIREHEKLQLADEDQFNAVYQILEWDNWHTENIAFSLAFGNESAVFNALQNVHYMGQSYAIYNNLKRPELVY